jgi:5'-nucleotidase
MKKKKNILVVNDDGIEAIGIRKLAEALAEVGDVYVCSPHKQRSASGHAITIGRSVIMEEAAFAGARQALSIDGTPVDCVKLGLEVYRDRGVKMDMVFSGFNHGMNLGTDTLYSGTVSAAIEGAMGGLPSAAMSISTKHTFHKTPENFEAAMEMAKKIAGSDLFLSKIEEDPKEPDINFINEDHVILNVNIPNLPKEEIKGVKVCPLSYHAYEEWFDEKANEEGKLGYFYAGRPLIKGEAEADDSDIIASGLGYITITPLHFDLTDRRIIKKMREAWNE